MSDKLPTCFMVSNKHGVSIEAASDWGRVRYLFEDKDDLDWYNNVFSNDFEEQCLRALKKHGYDYNTDYIVLSGSLLDNVRLISAILSEHLTVYVLAWYKYERKYRELEIGVKSSAISSDTF